MFDCGGADVTFCGSGGVEVVEASAGPDSAS